MRSCPNCGQAVATDADRFCPNCGSVLPVASATGAAPTNPQPTYQQPAQPAYQQPAQPTYTYTAQAPDPNAYSAPAYTSGGVGPGNLPVAGSRYNPSAGAVPGTNARAGTLRTIMAMDMRNLLIMAAVVVVAIIALVVIFQIVSWFLHLWWLWLIIIAAVAYAGQRRRGRGRRLP